MQEQRLQHAQLLGIWFGETHGLRKSAFIESLLGLNQGECLACDGRQSMQAAIDIVVHDHTIRPTLNGELLGPRTTEIDLSLL
ncbi:hypothetical protein [Hydrogenophaga sp.]|uniref:hypothetical protein n=1 Tax=Hydrogenophaga sp. TaxID=1904254 RepID=UPI00272419D9|nr:hypothetical protein [Hydrogenophaga sp.]MDO9438283.1 hypothetical protein [Hydrogenophaga sp.]